MKFAEIGDNDIFFDLGSGDGRVLIEAVKSFRVKKAVGYEISPWPYLKAKFLIRKNGLNERIHLIRKNFLEADLSEANIIYLYLFPEAMKKLALKFKEELPLGTMVLCVSFKIENPEDYDLFLKKEGKVDKFNLFLYEKR